MRGKEEYAGSPTFIYMTSSRGIKGKEIVIERDHIRRMKTGGYISTGGIALFPMMSKGDEEKY
jgi:hypothetical protein